MYSCYLKISSEVIQSNELILPSAHTMSIAADPLNFVSLNTHACRERREGGGGGVPRDPGTPPIKFRRLQAGP